LEVRIAAKLGGNQVKEFMNRLHVAVPAKPDGKVSARVLRLAHH
jgi:hypothetical protein